MAAEAELDRREGRSSRVDRALRDDDDAELDTSHRDRRQYDQDEDEEVNSSLGYSKSLNWFFHVRYLPQDEGFVLETFDCPLREWIATERVRQEVMRRYRKFLTTFIDDGSNVNVHQERINGMCGENEQSLEVSYLHLSRAAPILAIWTADAPKDMLEIFNEVTLQVTISWC